LFTRERERERETDRQTERDRERGNANLPPDSVVVVVGVTKGPHRLHYLAVALFRQTGIVQAISEQCHLLLMSLCDGQTIIYTVYPPIMQTHV
jgi:hypothetical protein